VPQKEKNKTCTQQLDHLLIKYTVEANQEKIGDSISAVDTSGSGADDTIVVQEIELIPKKKRVL
jgi:microcompartment protein CcmK/EutM